MFLLVQVFIFVFSLKVVIVKKFILFFIFLFFLYGCKESQKLPQNHLGIGQPSTQRTQSNTNEETNLIDLKLKPSIGKEYTFKNEFSQNITQQIDTLTVETQNTQVLVYSLKPISAFNDSILFQVNFKRIQQKIVSPLFTIEVNTSKTGKNLSPLEVFFSSIIGKNFGLIVNIASKKVEIIGFDSVLNKVIENISKRKEFSSIDRNMLFQISNSFFNPGELRKSFEKLFEIYPSKKISLGEVWDYDKEVFEPIPAKISNSFLLKKVVDDSLFVSQNTKINFLKGKQNVNEPKISEFIGNQSGEFVVSRISGLVIKSNMFQQINFVYTLPASPQTNNREVNVTTKIKSNFSLRLQ